MGYVGTKPSAVPLTSADITDGIITSAKIADGTIVNADIGSSAAVALSKLSTTGTADSTTYLRGDGAWTAVSSDYVLLATTDASNVASVSFDGYFSSTYKNYQLIISNLYAGTNNVSGYLRFRRSNADVTASNYTTISIAHQTAGYDGGLISGQSFGWFWYGGNYSNTSTDANSRIMTIFDPLSTTTYKNIVWSGYSRRYDGNEFVATQTVRLSDSTNALSGISILMSSGNLYGNFKLYGIK
jgi:hypothetical protein